MTTGIRYDARGDVYPDQGGIVYICVYRDDRRADWRTALLMRAKSDDRCSTCKGLICQEELAAFHTTYAAMEDIVGQAQPVNGTLHRHCLGCTMVGEPPVGDQILEPWE